MPRPASIITSSQSDNKILAAPRVIADSEKSALVRIGDDLCIDYFDPREGRFLDHCFFIGLLIDVVPMDRGSGRLDLQLKAETSLVTELVSSQYPVVETHVYEQTVALQEGETLALTGLLPIETGQALARLGLPERHRTLSGSWSQLRFPPTVLLTPHVMR